MQKIWQMWAGALSKEQVNNIIQECEYYQPQEAVVGDTDGKIKKTVRSSEVRWVDPNDQNSLFIKHLIMHYANHANRQAFGVDINDVYDIQYTIYDAKDDGHYDWHFDTFWGNESCNDRKLSVTIQLSDGKDYQGGDFILDPQYEQPNAKDLRTLGTVLVFPSPIRHKVEKVTKGIRKSLVAWIEGPKWK